jgi:Baseplate J-like protein
MTCTITRPDPQELFDHLKNMFSSTVLGGGKIYPESNEWYVVTNDYAAAEQFYAIADQLWRESNPETACCENLYKMAAQHGVFPQPASHAEGYARLTGIPGSAVPPSFEIQTSNGTYISVGTVPLTMPASGTVVVRIRALTPGADMNAGGEVTTGTLTTPAPGIDPEVTICGGSFCGGSEEESCEEFRKRYMARLAYQPKATMAWIKQKLMEFPCATRVCIREGTCCRCNADCEDCPECGCTNCGSAMQFYVLFDGIFPCGIPPQHVIDDIQTWLFGEHQGYGEGQVEIGVCGSIHAPRPLVVNVYIDIEGCPSSAQKQMIEDHIVALFQRVCPSMPLRVKQLDLIVASIIGPEFNTQVRFEVVGYEGQVPPYPRDDVWVTACGDLEPECDVLPCLNDVFFVGPDMRKPPC